MTSRWGNGLSQTLVSRLEQLERLRTRQGGRARAQQAADLLRLPLQRRLWQGWQRLKLQTVGELGPVEELIAKTKCIHCSSLSLQTLTPLTPSADLPSSLLLLLPSEARPKSPIAVSNPSTSELESLSAIPFESFHSHWDDRSSLVLEPPYVQGLERLKRVLLRPAFEGLGTVVWPGNVRTESSSSQDGENEGK